MDSSSDEEFFLLDSLFPKLIRPKRKNNTNKERASVGEYHHVFKKLKSNPDKFYSYMGMNLETFRYIFNKCEHRLMKTWCNWHRPILPEERLVVTLRYLFTGSSFKELAASFKMGPSSVGGIVTETVGILWDELHTQHMPAPTAEAFKTIAADFCRSWNFPHCLGVIDGKHIQVKCPADVPSSTCSKWSKNYFYIVLQAAVDARYRFITIDVGKYGKDSEGGKFQASKLYQSVTDNTLALPGPAFLPESKVTAPYVFVAGDDYPLLPFLVKPYGGAKLSEGQECFNNRLQSCRKIAEDAFGILSSKWSILSKCINTRADLADSTVKCLCILHNTIIDREGIVQSLSGEPFPTTSVTWEVTGRPTNHAKGVRDIFTSYFIQNP